MEVKFIHNIAKFWNVGKHSKFVVVKYSRSGHSAYIDINGVNKIVPTSILVLVN